MKFFSIFVAAALIFSDAALGRPSLLAERVIARARRTNPRIASERFSDVAHSVTSVNWAGAVIQSPPAGQKFTKVVGTLTVPTISGNGAASAWVGIDGDTATNSILQSGVDFVIDGGRTTYIAWTEWYPNFAADVDNFPISAGNQIEVTVTATTSTTGTVVLNNLSTGMNRTISLQAPSSSAALQGQNAEWIVEDFEQNGQLVRLANFGTVTFTGAYASTSSETVVDVSTATIINMEQNGKVLTDVSSSNSSLTVRYTG